MLECCDVVTGVSDEVAKSGQISALPYGSAWTQAPEMWGMLITEAFTLAPGIVKEYCVSWEAMLKIVPLKRKRTDVKSN